jgi:hypothetical protein
MSADYNFFKICTFICKTVRAETFILLREINKEGHFEYPSLP